METLLDTSSQRILNILLLSVSTSARLTSKDIRQAIGASEKTIQKDMNWLILNQQDYFDVTLDEQQIYTFNGLTHDSYIQFKSSLLKEAPAIKFIQKIFYFPNKDLPFYAKKCLISLSSLYRYLPRIKALLAEYGLILHSDKGSYSIISTENELNVRRFFASFLLEIYSFRLFAYIPHYWQSFLSKRFKEMSQQLDVSFTDEQTIFFTSLYAVSIHREEQGFNCHKTVNYPISFSVEDLDYIHHAFSTLKSQQFHLIETTILMHKSELMIPRYQKPYGYELEILANTLLASYDLPSLTNRMSIVLKDIYLACQIYDKPVSILINRYLFFALNIKKDYPAFYHSFNDIIKELSIAVGTQLTHFFDYFLFLFIASYPGVLQLNNQPTALIVSGHSTDHAHYLKQFISSSLNLDKEYLPTFTCIGFREAKEIDITDYPFILTTSFSFWNEHPSLLINDFPTKQDIKRIKNQIVKN